MCPAVVKSAEGEPRGREPAFAGSDPDPHAAEPDPAGADHGEQRPVPRRAETIHVWHLFYLLKLFSCNLHGLLCADAL